MNFPLRALKRSLMFWDKDDASEEGQSVSIARPLPVNQVTETNPPFDQYFMKANGAPTTLSVDSVKDEYEVTVANVAIFSVGDILFIASGSRFYVGGILSITDNTLTLDTPLDFSYLIGSLALSLTRNLAVDGSGTRQIFSVEAGANLKIHIHRILLTMLSTTAMDDGKFGGIPALTKGLVLRITDGTNRNIANAKKNGDFRVFAYDVEYLSKAPSGQYGIGIRFTFGGQSKHGTVINLDPGDKMEVLVQDDLTDLDELLVTAQGHIVEELA